MSELALDVRGLTVRYGTGTNALTAVRDVSLTLERGRTLGVVGESGSGKSTLARALVGLAPVTNGEISIEGRTVRGGRNATAGGRTRVTQLVFQNPYSSLNPRMTVAETLFEAQAAGGIDRTQRRRGASRLLELVGLDDQALWRFPHEFSGGQRQRIAIARSLAPRPRLIILDEVTSALDVSVQASVLNLLLELQAELGLSYLFISHNLVVVRHMSDTIAVMYLGDIVEYGRSGEVLENPRHPYTRSLMEAIPDLGGSRQVGQYAAEGEIPDPRHPPSGCHFRTRCPIGPLKRPERVVCARREPRLNNGDHRAACHFPLSPEVDVPRTVVETWEE